jgi:diguanylate cyclase (GGDEF)-like protein/PAS domain S-box-containing protein
LADSSIHRDTVLPNAPLLAPLPLTAREILQQSLNGRRVRLKGRLISQTPDAASFSYKLEDGGQTFIAILPRTQETREMVSLPLDHVLELTGIAVMQPGGGSLKVLIDSPAAMVVQEDKGWLTPRRAAALLGAMLFCVLTPLIWITQLRRTVRSQTALIRTKLENELQLETRYRRLFERNLAAVFTWRADGTIVDCNMAFVRMLGLRSREELLGRSYWDFEVDPVLREQLKRSLPEEALGNRDASLRRDDNVTVHLLKNITPVETPEGTIYETTAIDVTQLRHNQAELQRARDAAIYESLNDPLTGLPNRRLLLDTLSAMVARIRAEGGMIALLYIDLDGFKLVNDSLGHRVGDAMLVQMAACLRSWVREGDMLARLGGDEFMVILDRIHTRDDATQVAKDLLHAISSPVRIEGHVLALGASIGISIFPDNAQDAEELMQEADSAMYAAKREGKNRVMHYTPAMGVLVQERLSLENLLRGAIAREEIFLHFQPEFGVADHRLTRFEALARWTHPTLGSIPPLKFIPIAEESGMIDALGAYIMEQACLEAVRWQPQLPYSVQIAVNVSSIQFRRKGFVEEVFAILERTGLKPELLQIELTESVMLSGSSDTADIMNRLRDRGISLAIDDFGTGYSNLSYLPSLPFDFLKIDASFVRNMNAESESESMIKTLVVLAHNFGMRVIVEGVERADQLELIKGFGANEAQGYFLGRPNASPMDVLLPPEVT